MCSRTVSDTANTRIHERTQCVSAEEKILCRSPYFAAVTCRQSAPDPLRERGNSQEGGNRSFSRADFSQPREMFSIVTGMSFSAFNSADNVRF